jgi:hypothetical protein
MSNRINNMAVWIVAVMLASSVCLASPTLNFKETWDGPVGTTNWVSDAGATVSNPSGTNSLMIAFGGGPDSSYIYGTGGAGGQYGGNFNPAPGLTNLNVSFQFITGDATPGALYLAFGSGAPGPNPTPRIWRYDLTGSLVANSTNQFSNILLSSYSGLWSAFQGNNTPTQYGLDILAVDWIGIYVAQGGVDPETYWLNDWEYSGVAVPEPETVWMILAVVMSIGITFRSRLVDTMTQMKTRFTKV